MSTSLPPIEVLIKAKSEVEAELNKAKAKIEEYKNSSEQAMGATAHGSHEARAAVALLSEELGVGVNRHMRSIIASAPMLATALSAAFPIAAAIGFFEIAEKIPEAIERWTSAIAGFGKEAQERLAILKEVNKELAKSQEEREKKQHEIDTIGMKGSTKVGSDRAFAVEQQEKAQQRLNNALAETARLQEDAKKYTLYYNPNDTLKKNPQKIYSEDAIEAQKKLSGDPSAKDDHDARVGMINVVQELRSKLSDATLEVTKLGKETKVALGDEGKEAADRFKNSLKELNSELARAAQMGEGKVGPEAIAAKFDTEIQRLSDKFNAANPAAQTAKMRAEYEQQILVLARVRDATIHTWWDEQYDTLANAHHQAIKQTWNLWLNTSEAANRYADYAEKAFGRNPMIGSWWEDATYTKRLSEHAAYQDQMARTQREIFNPTGAMNKVEYTMVEGHKAFSALTTDLITGTHSISGAFQSMADSILQSLEKVVEKMLWVNLWSKVLAAGMNGLFPSPNMGSQWNAPFNANAGSVLNISGFAQPPGRASGGDVLPGMTYMVGENGPELLRMGGAGGTVIPNGKLGGGQPSVTVNVINNGSPVSAQQSAPRYDAISGLVVDVFLRNINENGAIGRTLRGR